MLCDFLFPNFTDRIHIYRWLLTFTKFIYGILLGIRILTFWEWTDSSGFYSFFFLSHEPHFDLVYWLRCVCIGQLRERVWFEWTYVSFGNIVVFWWLNPKNAMYCCETEKIKTNKLFFFFLSNQWMRKNATKDTTSYNMENGDKKLWVEEKKQASNVNMTTNFIDPKVRGLFEITTS